MFQARTNRIASLCATADNFFHFGWLRDQLFQFVETVAAADQNNFIYAIRVLERRDCVRNHRFAAHEREQFVEAHSLAAAGGNDDCAQHHYESCFCTSAFKVLPSARRAPFPCNAFMTAPICAFELAPTSVIVSRTIFESSSALICCGKYDCKIDNSSFSFAASSGRPPFSKLSIESCRCFTCLRITWVASASASCPCAPDFSIAAFIIAAFSMRNTPSFVALFSRIAVFRSSSTRWARLTPERSEEHTPE